MVARVEKPPARKFRKSILDSVDDRPEIIITDADESLTTAIPQESLGAKELDKNAAPETSRLKRGVFKREYESGKRSYARIIKHSFVFLLVIALGILFHKLLRVTGDPKLFDYIPWRYVLDGADATIAIRIVGVIWKELGKDD